MTGQPQDSPTAAVESASDERGGSVVFRAPTVTDGPRLWRLAADSGTLDVNSQYSYLLWCRDFSATSVVGCAGDSVITFVTGYVRPDAPDT